MLVSWLAIIFITFGLYAPRNATVVTVLIVCALSIAGGIFLDPRTRPTVRGMDSHLDRSVAQCGVPARPVTMNGRCYILWLWNPSKVTLTVPLPMAALPFKRDAYHTDRQSMAPVH